MLAADKYDLLMTDINMPMMDGGVKLVSLIRNDNTYRHLPIVMITTEGGSQVTREKVLKLGATEYLTKPLQTTKLIETVRRLLDPELCQS